MGICLRCYKMGFFERIRLSRPRMRGESIDEKQGVFVICQMKRFIMDYINHFRCVYGNNCMYGAGGRIN